jgi:hypothetical protein
MFNNFKLVPIFLFFTLFICSSLAEIEINEIMYSPFDGNEWVEIYNSGNSLVNLSNWFLEDSKSVDNLECCPFSDDCNLTLLPEEYAIIVDQDTTLPENLNSKFLFFCVDDNSLGNGLSDKGDSISIYNNNSEGTSFSYEKSFGAYKNNKTLERRKDSSWGESVTEFGTPGEENSIFDFSKEYSQLEISEIMADPFDEDNLVLPQGEWVEFYNKGDQNLNLNGLIIKDKDSDNELTIAENKVLGSNTVITSNSYLVVYRNADTDFSLNNNGFDKVRLFYGDNLITEASYSDSTEGMSWAKIGDDWRSTEPTPGKENVYVENCNWEIDLNLNNSIFKDGSWDFEVAVKRLLGSAEEITVKGKIEDINGEVLKEYSPWTSQKIVTSKTKTYSPNLPEGEYQISFWLEGLLCNDHDLNNNQVAKLIAINPQYHENQSTLGIEKIYLGNDKKAEWGDQFTAKINVYKGEETKQSVQVWVEKDGEKVSKTSKLNVYDKYKNYPLTVPLQLLPNCHQKISDGNVLLVVDAFGLRQEMGFLIQGVDKDVCKDYLAYVKELGDNDNKQKKLTNYQIVDLPSTVSSGKVLDFKVQIINEKKEQDYQIWSYVYRGNKCYSCLNSTVERELNLKQFSLNNNENKMVDFLLKLDSDLKEGEYKLKVKMIKGKQKTSTDLTETFYVLGDFPIGGDKETLKIKLSEDVPELTNVNQENDLTTFSTKKELMLDQIEGIVVYESSSEKAKKVIPYLLSLVLGLICIILVFRK